MKIRSIYKIQSAVWRLLNVYVAAMIMSSCIATDGRAAPVTFGVGVNQFSIDFVTIGDLGNIPDTTGAPNPGGSVGYRYGIAKFEISEQMINKYNANFGSANGLVITKHSRGPDKPATGVNWNATARFVNWLNTSKGFAPAYKFTTSGVNDNLTLWTSADAGYDATNPYRNRLAKYVLPNLNEWYKAAYYNPKTATYYNYPTGSDTHPTSVVSGTAPGTAVFNQSGPADVDKAGGLSPYGVMGLGGNVFEWQETSASGLNNNPTTPRVFRGGAYEKFNPALNYDSLAAGVAHADGGPSGYSGHSIGFRVVTFDSASYEAVPEPSMLMIGALLGVGGLIINSRRKKQNRSLVLDLFDR